jgi:hypothetical protein
MLLVASLPFCRRRSTMQDKGKFDEDEFKQSLKEIDHILAESKEKIIN